MNYYHYSGQPKPTSGQMKVISSSNNSASSNKKKKSSGCGCGKKVKVIQED